MVFQKMSYCGFEGYRVPGLPQGSRSIRKKRSNLRRNLSPEKMDAMDLLATVAGMLLVEKGKAPALETKKVSAVQAIGKPSSFGKDKPMKADQFCQGRRDRGGASIGNAHGQTSSGSVLSGSSSIVKVEAVENGSNKGGAAIKIEVPISKNSMGIARQMEMDSKPPPALFSSDSSVDPIPCNLSSPKFGKDDIQRDPHGDDDDENSSGCTHPGPISPRTFSTHRSGDRRNRKLWSSKLWKLGPALLKDSEFFCRDVEKPMFRSKKLCCKQRRTQRSPFKRRKLYERSSSIFMEKRINHERSSSAILHGEDRASSLLTKPKSTIEAEDYKVRLTIKSFKIPELLIEMPENATVGSLKRTVLETVTAMLGNGLRVGVILQGRKVRDDSNTLLQAGITRGEKLDTLGFTLEPTSSPLPSCESESPEPLARLPALPNPDTAVIVRSSSSPDHGIDPPRTFGTCLNDCDPELTGQTPPISKALVHLGPSGDQPKALVNLIGKPRRSEVAQRRIRRPFSVAEVEALVQAVEKLGTGRWRDVKIRAFAEAKHRTYVDLKDKWKTLVHTAKISPQQRRGEPVPQDLLDRVLEAHAYWSQHQSKLQSKQQPQADQCLLQL